MNEREGLVYAIRGAIDLTNSLHMISLCHFKLQDVRRVSSGKWDSLVMDKAMTLTLDPILRSLEHIA